MKQERRRLGGFLAALAADPVRKLAALALAFGLWVLLDSQVTRTLELTMPLTSVGRLETASGPFSRRVAIELPTNRVVGRNFYNANEPGPAMTELKIVFRGPRYLIDSLENQQLDLRITKFVNTDWSETTSVNFTAADVDRNLKALQDPAVQVEMMPLAVRLEVERIESHSQPLSLEDVELVGLDAELAARLRRDTVRFAPDTARILGPASSLAGFPPRGGKPFRARLGSPGNAREITTILELTSPPEAGLRLAETPSLTVQLMPVTEVFEVELPVVVDDAALPDEWRGLYRPEKPTELVRIRAGGNLRAQLVLRRADDKLDEFATEYLRLDVYVERPAPGSSFGSELPRVARLAVRGPLQDTVETTDYRLDQPLLVRLLRKP
jgi:hypothetical protein